MSAGDIIFILFFVFSLFFELSRKASKKKNARDIPGPDTSEEVILRQDIPGKLPEKRISGKKSAAYKSSPVDNKEDVSLPESTPVKKEKIDKKKLVVYSEIMKPKYF